MSGTRNRKYKKYWYPAIVDFLRVYRKVSTSDEKTHVEEVLCKAVRDALKDTKGMKEGSVRVKAVKMVYIDRTHNCDSASLALYVNSRTIQTYLSDFVYLVGEKVGF